MCGIAGVVQLGRAVSDPSDRLSRSLSSLSHRGPDGRGEMTWESAWGCCVDMGMTRLAVLDLSPSGQQPMTTPDGRFTIVFNGEITNFVELRSELQGKGVTFHSRGDTEVLLRAWEHWGARCRQRLDGMYAFAVLDRHEATLTLVRDPFGIKPLYIAQPNPDCLAFGSEVRSLLPFFSSIPSLDWQVAARYLSTGLYDDGPQTFVDGIQQVAPGSMVVVDLETGEHQKLSPDWWPSLQTHEGLTLEQAAEAVRDLLTHSVRRNLRSDVPLGVALSGGIDSTAMVHLVRAIEPDLAIRMFSYIAPGTATDESPWISKATASSGGTLTTVEPRADDLIRDLDDLIVAQGEPFASTSIYAQYRVFQAMSESGVVVSLDGQGGDEVFAGYQGYPGQRVRSLFEGGRWLQGAHFLGQWSRWPGRSLPKGLARVALQYRPELAFQGPIATRLSPTPPGLREGLLRERIGDPRPEWSLASNDGVVGVRVKAELRASLLERGLQSLLRHGDRNSMHWSVESRVPFLDRALVQFTLSLPERFLVDPSGTSKAVLRKAMKGLVPEEILLRRDKVGFETPDTMWLERQREVLADRVQHSPPVGFLDTTAVVSAIRGERGHPKLQRGQMWRLVNLYRWAELMGVRGT